MHYFLMQHQRVGKKEASMWSLYMIKIDWPGPSRPGVDSIKKFLLSKLLSISGQSYKHFTIVNYDSRFVITSKLLTLTTLES